MGGNWKILRIANGRALRGGPIYLPNDTAIPAKGVPAAAHFTRPFEREKHILLCEAVGDPPGLATITCLLLLAIVTGWLAAMVWGMRQLQLTSLSTGEHPGRRPARIAVPGLWGRSVSAPAPSVAAPGGTAQHAARRDRTMIPLPFADFGHVLIDLPIFFGPVAVLAGGMLVTVRRDRRQVSTTADEPRQTAPAGHRSPGRLDAARHGDFAK